MNPLSRGRQFALSVLLTAAGLLLAGYGGVTAIEGMHGIGADTRLDTTGIIIFSIGAVFFAVGAMWLLVVMVRPFFDKRDVDRYAEQTSGRGPGRG